MLRDLFDYTFYADRLIINAFDQAEIALPEAERLFSHVLNAQHIWINRIAGTEPLFERFHLHDKHHFAILQSENETRLNEILEKEPLDKRIYYYTSLRDREYANKIADILFHVVNHSTYHRGQIATEFRINGITPPPTDYIVFKRG